MAAKYFVRFAYFGYSAMFETSTPSVEERRAEANRIVIARYGAAPQLSYAAPGVPFPDFVPMTVWDEEAQAFI